MILIKTLSFSTTHYKGLTNTCKLLWLYIPHNDLCVAQGSDQHVYMSNLQILLEINEVDMKKARIRTIYNDIHYFGTCRHNIANVLEKEYCCRNGCTGKHLARKYTSWLRNIPSTIILIYLFKDFYCCYQDTWKKIDCEKRHLTKGWPSVRFLGWSIDRAASYFPDLHAYDDNLSTKKKWRGEK